MEELTVWDYVNRPLAYLVAHPGYSADAMRTVTHLMTVKTTELERLGISWRNL